MVFLCLPLQSEIVSPRFKSDLGVDINDCSTSLHQSSSSVKQKLRFSGRCSQCLELESRLNLALEELEMALKRETQNIIGKSEENDNAMSRMQSLIKHCQQLEEELNHSKTKVVDLLEERDQLLNEKERREDASSMSINTMVNSIHEAFEDLFSKLKRKRKWNTGMSLPTTEASYDPRGKGFGAISTILEEEEELEEGSEEIKVEVDSVENVVKKEVERLEKEVNALEESWSKEKDRLEKQRAGAEDRQNKAEQELQVYRCEYEKSEDYWHFKFQEEQDYYEEERKLYDEKFSALEAKIREYEEVALTSAGAPVEVPGPSVVAEAFSDDSEDRLSTIDESAVWERQVTDLEEEVRSLQKKLLQASEELDNEHSLREKITTDHRNAQMEIKQLKAELEQASTMVRALDQKYNFACEELEHFKDNFGRESDLRALLNQEVVNGHEYANDNYQSEHCGAAAVGNFSSTSRADIGSANGREDTAAFKVLLNKYEKRIQYLEHMQKLKQKCSNDIIKQTNERHKLEIQNLQSMMTSTQQMFASNLAKYKDQMTKVARNDLAMRELYLENTQMMLALKITEERQKRAEEQLRKNQMAALFNIK